MIAVPPILIILFVLIGLYCIGYACYSIYKRNSSTSSKNTFPNDINSASYRKSVYKNVPQAYKPEIHRLYTGIDDIDAIIRGNKTKLDSQATQIAKRVLERAITAEKEINSYWERRKRSAEFYYYIGLHYASFTLADKLTEELDTLRKYNSALTEVINSVQRQIDELSRKINYMNGNVAEQKRNHQELCRKCKSLRDTRQFCNSQKNQLQEQRDRQNRLTAERRDYIGTHFGEKGRNWRERILTKRRG